MPIYCEILSTFAYQVYVALAYASFTNICLNNLYSCSLTQHPRSVWEMMGEWKRGGDGVNFVPICVCEKVSNFN